MVLSITNSSAITAADAYADAADVGTTNPNATLVIYDGVPPALVDAALSGNNVLVSLAMSNPAFGNAVDTAPGATVTANAVASAMATAGGTASFFRIFDRDNTAVIQGSITVTGGGGELELNIIVIVVSVLVTISSLTMTQPEG